jgi:GMP synthase (glutamine-hydrolysing)
MAEKVLLIDHHDNFRDDLATTHLRSMGLEIVVCNPFQGDDLPTATTEFVGAVIYGGDQNVTEIDKFPFLQKEIDWIKKAISENFPILGICLGAQLIAHSLGAKVGPRNDNFCEFGYYEITPTAAGSEWFNGAMNVTQAHYQHYELPKGATLLASGENFPNQAYKYGEKVFAVQFHPEVTAKIFRRWQDSDWAFFGRPGAQSREQQDELINKADPIQCDWFENFLESFFVSPTHLD